MGEGVKGDQISYLNVRLKHWLLEMVNLALRVEPGGKLLFYFRLSWTSND